MRRWWCSWYEATDDSGDWRPTTWPPSSEWLGYWCSGWREDDATVVAWVVAEDEDALRQVVSAAFPGASAEEWRFANPVSNDWTPGDRFQIPEWSPAHRDPSSPKAVDGAEIASEGAPDS